MRMNYSNTVTELNGEYLIVLTHKPTKIQRAIGMKPHDVKFTGDCTVWYKITSDGLKRASSDWERYLCDIWKTYKYNLTLRD